MSRTHLYPLPVKHHKQSPATRMDRALSFPCTSIGLKSKTKKRRRDGRETPMGYLSSYVAGRTCSAGPYIDNILIIDWFVLGYRCSVPRGDLPNPAAERTGRPHVLSRHYHRNPDHHRFQWIIANDLATPSATQSLDVQATQISYLVQFTLVLQPRDQSHLRSASHVFATVGPPIRSCDATPLQPPQARADPRVFRRGHREAPFTLGRRSAARVASCFRIPFLRGSHCIFIHHSSHGLLDRAFVHGSLHRPIPVHHHVAYLLPRQPVFHPAHPGRLVLRHRNLLGHGPHSQNHRFEIARAQARELGRLV